MLKNNTYTHISHVEFLTVFSWNSSLLPCSFCSVCRCGLLGGLNLLNLLLAIVLLVAVMGPSCRSCPSLHPSWLWCWFWSPPACTVDLISSGPWWCTSCNPEGRKSRLISEILPFLLQISPSIPGLYQHVLVDVRCILLIVPVDLLLVLLVR